jgi:hypothetical protein
MHQLDLLVLSLATWRLAYMLVKEDGPLKVFSKIRTLPHGGVFDCIYCCSMWVAFAGVAVWHYEVMVLAYPFAISGAAMMLRAFTGAGLHDV